MANVCFFSFTIPDHGVVATIKGKAVNPYYYGLNFRVKDLLKRWQTEDKGRIRQAITQAMQGTSRTILFVGETTYKSTWVAEEVEKTLANGKKLFAIRLNGTGGPKPQALIDNGITLHPWSESNLQDLATK